MSEMQEAVQTEVVALHDFFVDWFTGAANVKDLETKFILRVPEDMLYTEWQSGARQSTRSENGRVATVLLSRTEPFRWLHLHETWLPESVQNAGDYSFAIG